MVENRIYSRFKESGYFLFFKPVNTFERVYTRRGNN